MNTYEQQLELVSKKLATVKHSNNLSTFKYARKVMYDYLWDSDQSLLECRGHTYDNSTGELVVAAPRKSFNYLENGWWKDKPLNTPVIAYKKYNGFMACVSKHQGEVVISTTGSTTSNFVNYAKELLSGETFYWLDHCNTLLYEIVHEDDPHIVADALGAHYLGYRNKTDGCFEPYGNHGDIYLGTLKGILAIAQVNQGEGFMVYDLHNDPDRLSPAKVKTPYYVYKKKLMRAGDKHVADMYSNTYSYCNSFPKVWQDIVHAITLAYTWNDWLGMHAQQRRYAIEQLFHGA